jgi:hypothetical protein
MKTSLFEKVFDLIVSVSTLQRIFIYGNYCRLQYFERIGLFQGEWTIPKELQCLKTKACLLCGQNINTARLVQPNESKRRSKFLFKNKCFNLGEELLRRIRERHSKTTNKESDDTPSTTSSSTTHLLVPPV